MTIVITKYLFKFMYFNDHDSKNLLNFNENHNDLRMVTYISRNN